MPKMKTHRGAMKRFKKTGKGALKHAATNRRHILTKKAPKRKRNLRALRNVDDTLMRGIQRLMLSE